MSEPALPVVVGARARAPGDRGDQLVHDVDGGLTIIASSVIDGVEVGGHRPCLLRVNGVALRVVGATRDGPRYVYRLVPYVPGLYEVDGAVIDYNADRVRDARVERLGRVAGFVVMLLLWPLYPLLGLLPENAKRALSDRGIVFVGAQTSSIVFEWMLTWLLAAAELLAIFALQSVGVAVVLGACAIVLLIDIAHRQVHAAEGRAVGFLAWPRELVRNMRDEPTPDDAAQTRDRLTRGID